MSTREDVAEFLDARLYADLRSAVDRRTLEIVDRRRQTDIIRRRGWLVRRMLAVADVIGFLAAFVLAEWLVPSDRGGTVNVGVEVLVFVLTLPGWLGIAKLYGLYDRDDERTDHSTVDELVGVLHVVTIGTWLFWVVCYLSGIFDPRASKLFIFWMLAISLVAGGRATARTLARRSITYLQNALIVGAGDVGQLIARKLVGHSEYGINLVGFVDDNPRELSPDLGHVAYLGGTERLTDLVRLLDIERVVFAFTSEPDDSVVSLLRSLDDMDVQVDIVPRLFEVVGPGAHFHAVEGLPLLGLRRPNLSRSSLLMKRILDVAIAGTGLVVLAPALAAIAALVKLTSPGPVFYLDERIGKNGCVFRAFKFRTMRVDAKQRLEELLKDPELCAEFERTRKLRFDPRVTPIGQRLRALSLDELPQLVNVLRGDISLVGPRPVTKFEYDSYLAPVEETGYWHFGLRPGLTGYWQINGRSAVDYQDRLRLDRAYASSWSLALDLEILAKTARALTTRSGAY